MDGKGNDRSNSWSWYSRDKAEMAKPNNNSVPAADLDRSRASRSLDKDIEAAFVEGNRLIREIGQRFDKENDFPSSASSPLAAFKRFIDSNVSTLAEGLTHLPSNIAELRGRMQREQERLKQEEQDVSFRWTGSCDSPDQIQLSLHRSTRLERANAAAATQELIEESLRRNSKVRAGQMRALFEDDEGLFGELDRFASPMLSFGGACYYKPEDGDNLPSTAAAGWRWPIASPRWLSIDWFKRSPYSPILLEAHPATAESGSKWRAAFEDLMCATLDKPMMTSERVGQRAMYGTAQSTYHGPGLDWFLSLQCRGILPPVLPRSYNSSSPRPLLHLSSKDYALTPWHTDPKIVFSSTEEQDLSALMAEVATKATPVEGTNAYAFGAEPATEQDIYENMSFCSNTPTTKTRTEHMQCPSEPSQSLHERDEPDSHRSVSSQIPETPSPIRSSDQIASNMNEQDSSEEELEASWDRLVERIERHNQERQALEAMLGERPQEKEVEFSKPDESHRLPANLSKSNVLSALTTTHTTRLPDGTVTTKVVLKQRFADGREETSESVHTTHESCVQTPEAEQEQSKKKGWFWS